MKNRKGFTLVEIIVSVILIMIVLFYLLRSIINISGKNTDLTTRQEYSVYENNLLTNFYKDTDKMSDNIEIGTINENLEEGAKSGIYAIEYVDIKDDNNQPIKLIINTKNNSIEYHNVIYKLPKDIIFLIKDGKPYSIDTIKRQKDDADKYGMKVTNIYVKIHDTEEVIKLMYQGILKTYTINFYTNEDTTGQTPDFYTSISVIQDTDLTQSMLPPAPTNSNSNIHFKYWSKIRTRGSISLPLKVDSDMSLYAQWGDKTEEKYIVKYNPNFEQKCSNDICSKLFGEMADSEFYVGVEGYLKENTFVRKEMYNNIEKVGYKFIGWNTQADGKGKSYSNSALVKDLASANGVITLYAQWQKDGWDFINITTHYGQPDKLKTQEWAFWDNGVKITSGFKKLCSSYNGSNKCADEDIVWYHFTNSKIDLGFITDNGKTYFCSYYDKNNNNYVDGAVLGGYQTIEGKQYYFNPNGNSPYNGYGVMQK